MDNQLIDPKKASSGFTLIELLAVIAVMVLVLAIAGAALMPSNRSLDLASVSLQVKGYLDQGRQMALAHNKYVQVRFYTKTGDSINGVPVYSALGLFVADSPYYYASGLASDYTQPTTGVIATGVMTAMAPILYLSPSTVLVSSSSASSSGTTSLLNDLSGDTYFTRKGTGDTTLQGATYDWISFYYTPNGSTDFQTINGSSYPPIQSYFSLVSRNEYQGHSSMLPPNFFTFFLPPATGRSVILRP